MKGADLVMMYEQKDKMEGYMRKYGMMKVYSGNVE